MGGPTVQCILVRVPGHGRPNQPGADHAAGGAHCAPTPAAPRGPCYRAAPTDADGAQRQPAAPTACDSAVRHAATADPTAPGRASCTAGDACSTPQGTTQPDRRHPGRQLGGGGGQAPAHGDLAAPADAGQLEETSLARLRLINSLLQTGHMLRTHGAVATTQALVSACEAALTATYCDWWTVTTAPASALSRLPLDQTYIQPAHTWPG